MITPGPGGFGEASSEMAPPQPQKETISEGGRSYTVEPSGLAIPTRLADERAANNDQNQNTESNVAVENHDVQAIEVAEVDPKDLTTKERVENVNLNLVSIEDTPSMKAGTEGEFIQATIDDAKERGESEEEVEAAEDRAKTWLKKASAIAGTSFDAFKEANEGASMGKFIDLFLVFGVEGNFGGTSRSELRGSLEEDSSDLYLMEILEKGGSETVIKFFEKTLEESNIKNIDNIRDYIKAFNIKTEADPDGMKKKMSNFLNDEGRSGDHDFSGITRVFSRLEGMNPDNIRSFFHIETEETSNEADDGTGDADDTATTSSSSTQGNQPVTQFPTS